MNWIVIERAILEWTKDHHVVPEDNVVKKVQGDTIVDSLRFNNVNISELARAIERAVVVRVD